MNLASPLSQLPRHRQAVLPMCSSDLDVLSGLKPPNGVAF